MIQILQMAPVLAIAALLHDIGKANDKFQQKLTEGTIRGDDFRHEWVSMSIFAKLVNDCGGTDEGWLSCLARYKTVEPLVGIEVGIIEAFPHLPPIAHIVAWLIISHHKLPNLRKEEAKKYSTTSPDSFEKALSYVKSEWGYRRSASETARFSRGLLEDCEEWKRILRNWAEKALKEKENILALIESASLRPLAQFMRLSLMLGDYQVSSASSDEKWKGTLYANTKNNHPDQKLDEHLVAVSKSALSVAQWLPNAELGMESVQNVLQLQLASPAKFAWQDRVVEIITASRQKQKTTGWFVVNIASTGCGKTFANAKIMRALSKDGDSLRYTLALGLRSLTLQTGEEYRRKIGLTDMDMAVLVGDSGEQNLETIEEEDENWQEELLLSDMDYSERMPNKFLSVFFDSSHKGGKNEAFISKPVVVATIDHIIAATETIKGGRWILPFLRLATADLVIDEVDDFSQNDLYAIARLVHLAGMLSRNVCISSATIPPDLAKALFISYFEGKKLCGPASVLALWCDEFAAESALITENTSVFEERHKLFAEKHAEKITAMPQRRKAVVVDCQNSGFDAKQYFAVIRDTAKDLHNKFSFEAEGKHVSIGFVRFANINPCVACTRFLLNTEWDEDTDVRVMSYHSRYPRLLRYKKEQYIDMLLNREGEWMKKVFLQDRIAVDHIRQSSARNLLFIVVTTPALEIGRNVDFDYGIFEPSSMRSSIQAAGRVLRHRDIENLPSPNIAILRYNIKALQGEVPAFSRPGYETNGKYSLNSHDLMEIIPVEKIKEGLNSSFRVRKPMSLTPEMSLVDLEHYVMEEFANSSGGFSMKSWTVNYWWATGLAQSYRRFREGDSQIEVCLCYGAKDSLGVYEKTPRGEYVEKTAVYNIQFIPLSEQEKERLWLHLDYEELLGTLAEKEIGVNQELAMKELTKRHGKASIYASSKAGIPLYYNDDLGFFREVG